MLLALSSSFWLDLTNILLGVGTLIFVAVVLGAMLQELWSQIRGTAHPNPR